MNQGFAMDKDAKWQAFQIQAKDSVKFRKLCEDERPQEQVFPKRRKPIKSWRFKDEIEKPAYSYLNFPKFLDCSSEENTDFRKIAQTNVFIDSYYPKLVGDFSEDCSRKSSGHEEIQSLWVEDSSERDSRKTYDRLKKVPSHADSEFVKVVFKNKKSRKSDCPPLHKSSRSRLTLNCNTYTLIGISSEQESFDSRSSSNINGEVTKASSCCLDELWESRDAWSKKEKIKNLTGCAKKNREVLSAPGCFAHLYKRIETLEELLHQNLEDSDQSKEFKYTEKVRNRERVPQPIRSKIALLKTSEPKNHLTSTTRGKEAEVTERKENSDTENELRSIKKRLSALEKRLRNAKNSAALYSEAAGSTIMKKYSSSNETIVENGYRYKMAELVKPEKVTSVKKGLSQTTFVVPNFILRTRSEAKSNKLTVNGTTERVRRKKFIKCKRIKKKNSSVFISRKKTLRAKKPSLKINDRSRVPHVQSIIIEKTTESTFPTFYNTEKKSQRCATELGSQIIEKSFKKHQNKLNNLCKKTSITNIMLAQGERTGQKDEFELTSASDGENERPIAVEGNAWTSRAYKFRTNGWPPCSCWMTFSARYPQSRCRKSVFRKNSHYDSELEKTRISKKQSSLIDPIEILKGGGKIRIPVLFEEVCKTSKSKIPGRNLSDISMRFVLVQEDPRHPLSKLIKKLSRGKSTQKMEHYLFGVSKCSCNSQSQRKSSAGHSESHMKERKTKMRTIAESWESRLPDGFSHLNLTILALFLLVAGHYWRRRHLYKLAAMIDGPKPLPVIGNAMEYLALDHVKILDYLLEITTKFNGLAKVWLGGLLLIHISNPEDVEILLSSHKHIEKNKMYRFFDDVLGQGLLNARGDIWKKHRKIIAPTFHPSILKHFVKIFSEQSKILVKVLEKNADGRIFNVFPYVRNCALDFITETALENHIGAQLRVVAPATRAAERLMNITYNRMFKLWLYSDFIFYRTQQGKEYLRLRDLVKESTEPLLEVKKKEVAEKDQNQNNKESIKRKSFFRQLVELNENAENFNDKELRDEVVTMIITGYETTAATIGFILVMLGIHQNIQARVYEEVVTMEEFLKGREPEADDLTRFEYMDRVIKETLRLYPVGPIIFRECTTDVKLTTCTIPKGASVAVVILKTHRDPTIWDNPENFDPDHFLPEKCEKRHPYAYIPFSAGPRNCIGKQYAYLSMKVMLYYILSKYQVICDLRNEDIKIKSEVTMKMVGGFKIRLLPRKRTTVN